MKKKDKVYHTMAEIDKRFFPVLVKERKKKERQEREERHPEEAGKRIAKEIIEKAKEKLK